MALLRDMPRWLTWNAGHSGPINMLQGVHAFARPKSSGTESVSTDRGGKNPSPPQPPSHLPKAKARRPAVAVDWGVCERVINHRQGATASMATSLTLTASANRAPSGSPKAGG